MSNVRRRHVRTRESRDFHVRGTESGPNQSSPPGLSAAACDDLLCTPDEVYFYLSSLDPSKATGPDEISAQMLRQTADSITPSVTELLNLSLRYGCVPKE